MQNLAIIKQKSSFLSAIELFLPDFCRKLVVNIKKFDFNHFDREIFFCLFMDQLMSVFVLILSANDPDPEKSNKL